MKRPSPITPSYPTYYAVTLMAQSQDIAVHVDEVIEVCGDAADSGVATRYIEWAGQIHIF